jgi:hypothetical protein
MGSGRGNKGLDNDAASHRPGCFQFCRLDRRLIC